jgi:hypothetical protein
MEQRSVAYHRAAAARARRLRAEATTPRLKQVREHVGTKLPIGFIDLGEQQVKNIAQPIRAYQIGGAAKEPAAPASLPLPDKPSIAVLPFANMSGDPTPETQIPPGSAIASNRAATLTASPNRFSPCTQ